MLYETVFHGGFAVLKDCDEVAEKLSFLINRVFVEEDLLEVINYGVRGYNFDEEADYYYRIKNEDNSWRLYPGMSVNIINNLSDSKSIYQSQDDYLNNKENYDIIREQHLLYYEVIDNLKNNDPKKIYEHDFNKELHVDLDAVTKAIDQSFRELLQSIFTNEKTVDEAIQIYQNKYFTDGYKEYIDELNGY